MTPSPFENARHAAASTAEGSINVPRLSSDKAYRHTAAPSSNRGSYSRKAVKRLLFLSPSNISSTVIEFNAAAFVTPGML